MTLAWPQALLVEHPALRLPVSDPEPPPCAEPIRDLARDDRVRSALQLVAVAALLSDFELWPRQGQLRRASVTKAADGTQVVVPGLPVPISPVWARLGGGHAAVEITTSAVLGAVAEVTALDADLLDAGGVEPSFALDTVIERLLDELPSPLDPITARSLWMLRWSMPDPPEPGDTVLYAVRNPRLAIRVAAAVWSAARRRGSNASLEIALPGVAPRTVAASDGDDHITIVAGAPDASTLATRLDRAGHRGGSVLVLGELPRGWNAEPAPVFDADRIPTHLSVVGMSPARRLRWLDRRSGRFDPLSPADRHWLTTAAARRFRDRPPAAPHGFRALVDAAGLVPGGVPIEVFCELAECDRERLEAACAAGAIAVRDGRAMLPEPPLLGVDPRHGALAGLHPPNDPRRLLHDALGTGHPGALLDWARERLDDLDARAVRELLSDLTPGALGPAVDCALAEACLSLADIHGARRALAALDAAVARPWTRWLRLLDRTPGLEVDLPTAAELNAAPRAWAEIALVSVRRATWRDPDRIDAPAAVVRSARDRMSGAGRRWVDIRLTALLDPDQLEDGAWRRKHAAGHPELIGLVLFEQSLHAERTGRKRLAVRLLKRVLQREPSPGRRALMLINLGGLLFDLGRVADSESTTLRAYRLFQTAGFHHRVHEAVHNLAVADLDALRIDRAAARLDALSDAADPLYVAVERARLDLARGDLDRFRARLAELPRVDELHAPDIAAALALLHGVDALFTGDPATAVDLLRQGGDEAKAWIALATAVAGDPCPCQVKEDVWGMCWAASTVRSGDGDGTFGPDAPSGGAPRAVKRALGLAVVRHLGFGGDVDRTELGDAARLLDDGGLTGWAGRLWWGGPGPEQLLTALTRMARKGSHSDVLSEDLLGVLAPLGLTGVVLRSVADGRVLLRAGHGAPHEPELRRTLELVPLGAAPVSRAGWSLLFDVLESAVPHGVVAAADGAGSRVRMDGVSPAMTELRSEIARVAPTRLTVLIEGETGSGKEVVAREIHRLSGRAGELVAVNIAAVPAPLLESELFGSVKGAFTGAARSRLGLVRSADGGTLFLDEIGDLDSTLQVKLLRFLESGEVRPVGSDRSLEVDVRVVCATHRNLERRVRQGGFREDLFYRIAIARLRVPALRNRPEDIPVLREAFERAAVELHGLQRPPWSAAAERLLVDHSWPGNLRELRHCVEVAMSRAGGGTVRPEHLPLKVERPISRGTWEASLAEYKRRLLTEVLGSHHGNRSAAARQLGISRQALLYQIKKLGLDGL